MAWSAEIIGKAEQSGALVVSVRYTDGATTITESIQTRAPGGDWPIPDIQGRLKSLELVSANPVAIGAVAPAVAPPKPDADALAFAALATRTRRLMRLVGFGLTAVQPDLDAALLELNATYKVEYEELI